jgi:hypothetical protein
VKDEGANPNTLAITLSNIMSCVPFLLPQPYIISCYEYAMSKCCQYAINDLKMWCGMRRLQLKWLLVFFLKDDRLDIKKWEGKIEMGLHKCISSPLETKDSCQDLVGFQSDIIQRNFGIQK